MLSLREKKHLLQGGFMKKIFTWLMLISLVLSLYGCGTGARQEEPKAEEEETDINLYGYGCTMCFRPGTLYDENTLFWYKQGTKFFDMARKRLDDIQKEYNCSIKTVHYDTEAGIVSVITSAAASAKDGPDVSTLNLYTTVKTLCQSGMFLPLDEYEEFIPIHDESLYGPANIQEPALFNGHPYMVIPYTHPERQLLIDHFLTFNETLLEMYSVPDLRSVYENKQWTWDYFKDFLSNHTVTEEGQTVVYGLAGYYLPSLILASNGFELAYKDESGNYVSGTTTPNVLAAIDFYRELKTNYKDKIKICSDYDTAVEMMVEGQAFICSNEISDMLATIQFKVEKFGVLPFPYGPSGEYGKSLSDPEIYGSGLNVTSADPESAAIILNAYCQPFEEYPSVDDALTVYHSMFFDSRDITTLKDLTSTVRYLSWGGSGISNLVSDIESKLMTKSSAEIVSSVSDKMDKVVEEFILPNVEYTETYFVK